jgi:dipeptidyl-peptidase-4
VANLRTLLQIPMFRILSLCLLLANATTSFSQTRNFSIEDAFNPAYSPKGLSQLRWIPGTSKLSYVVNNGNQPKLVVFDAYNRVSDTLVQLTQLKQAIGETGLENKKMLSFPELNWKDEQSLWFVYDNKVLQYNIAGRVVEIRRVLPEGTSTREISAKTLNTAAVSKDNIYVVTGYSDRRITNDGGNGIVYGEAAHRNEFGIDKGLFWSPSGTRLAFYRQDERRVTAYPVYDLTKRPAGYNDLRYPCAGDSSHTVSIGVYDTETGQLNYLQTDGPYDQYLTNITWSPDDAFIYVAWVNREQNHMRLIRYDAFTGKQDLVLFEERSEKWVEPEHGPIFLPNNKDRFIWQSERDGWNHLYLYQTDGKLLGQITSGPWMVNEFIGFSKSTDVIYFTATKDSPLEKHLYSAKMNNGNVQRLTAVQGIHQILPASDNTLFIDVYSNRKTPRVIQVIKTEGDISSTLFSSPNPVADFKMGKTEIFPILNQGTLLHSRMIYPPDFNPKQKYPVVVYLYGGPHAQMVTESWLGGANLWMHYMAQQGYIVFTLDNRGSSNRGYEFESAIFRNLGTLEMEDQLAGVRYLRQFPFVDTARIGVHGWSFGGFMTTSLMTRYPGVYKVGVAGGPVIDWNYYEIMYTERYMDKPQENKEGYEKANLLRYADKLNGRLLMIHGTDDDVVLWQHSMLFVEQAVKARNAALDYFIYPGHKHNVIGPDRVHLYKKVSQYFFDFL